MVEELDQAIAEGTSELDKPLDTELEVDKADEAVTDKTDETLEVDKDPAMDAEPAIGKADQDHDQDTAPEVDRVDMSVEGVDTADEAASAKVHAATHSEDDHNDSYDVDKKAERASTRDAPGDTDTVAAVSKSMSATGDSLVVTEEPAAKASATVHAATHSGDDHNDSYDAGKKAERASTRDAPVDIDTVAAVSESTSATVHAATHTEEDHNDSYAVDKAALSDSDVDALFAGTPLPSSL